MNAAWYLKVKEQKLNTMTACMAHVSNMCQLVQCVVENVMNIVQKRKKHVVKREAAAQEGVVDVPADIKGEIKSL